LQETRRTVDFRDLRTHRQMWQTIARDIKEDIINGVYQPEERLMEADLALRYSVSKTPVREALRYLESVGFVEIIPHTMTIVKGMDERDVRNFSVVQGALEGLAARLSIQNLTRSDFDRMQGYVTLLEKYAEESVARHAAQYEKVHFKFHASIWDLSGNDRLIELAKNNHEHLERFRSVFRRFPGRFRSIAYDHRRILEAIHEKDGEKAEKLARRHIDRYAEIIAEALQKETGL